MFRMRLPLLTALALTLTAAASAQQTLPLWPHGTPEPPQTTAPETDNNAAHPHDIHYTNVTVPTLTVYPPHEHGNGTAALVFPGGGYAVLAWNKEGTNTCDWLNSIGVTCVLVKYRVPQPNGEAGHYPADFADLEDAQQAMRITRAHARDWHIDPNRIGVVGFSAGGNLAALLSTHPDDHHVETTPAAPDVDAAIDARPNFTVLIYPAYLTSDPGLTQLNPVYTPTASQPPVFLAAAENDRYFSKTPLTYYAALLDARVPAELHLFPAGGHGFGVYPSGTAGQWPALAAAWLRSLSMIPTPPLPHSSFISSGTPGAPPCNSTVSQTPQPGQPEKPSSSPEPQPCF
jgi:acetyl esterase/lipase